MAIFQSSTASLRTNALSSARDCVIAGYVSIGNGRHAWSALSAATRTCADASLPNAHTTARPSCPATATLLCAMSSRHSARQADDPSRNVCAMSVPRPGRTTEGRAWKIRRSDRTALYLAVHVISSCVCHQVSLLCHLDRFFFLAKERVPTYRCAMAAGCGGAYECTLHTSLLPLPDIYTEG